MIFKKTVVLFLLVCSTFILLAQQTTFPKFFEDDFKESFKSTPQIDVKFDSRFSFVRGTDLRTSGFKLGVSFNRKFKLGLGYNQLLIPARTTIEKQNKLINAELKYVYVSPYFEYVYYSSKRWDFNLSTQFGIGRAHYQFHDDVLKKAVGVSYSTIISYEPAMLIDYKIIKWFGIGTGVGYRLILFKSNEIKEKLSSPVYVVKVKVYLGEIVRTFTGKQIQAE